MDDIEVTGIQHLLTRREVASILGCSMRTVSRRIEDGKLETGYRSNGQRGILPASVEELVKADQTAAIDERDGSQSYARDPLPQALALAAAYATLAQAVKGHLDAGLLGRRATREQLREALEQSSTAVDTAIEPPRLLATLDQLREVWRELEAPPTPG